jgi:hypothetical protein
MNERHMSIERCILASLIFDTFANDMVALIGDWYFWGFRILGTLRVSEGEGEGEGEGVKFDRRRQIL